MRKIPTLFRRDRADLRRLLPEVHPACGWVLAGQGRPTRKYDGTCVLLDADGTWWARREVKPGKQPPANFRPVSTDEVTGKTVGWEPIEQSAFAAFHTEALIHETPTGERPARERHPSERPAGERPAGEGPASEKPTSEGPAGKASAGRHGVRAPGTYELCGPRINRNPEGYATHVLIEHAAAEVLPDAPRDFASLRAWLLDHPEFEGIVWHHEQPDGSVAMAKLKRRDFAA